jgi:hypothetical protein
MFAKSIDTINKGDLLSLIENGVLEGKIIEYKKELPSNKDESKKEFLADVSSFANAAGGYLIYGISEAEGLPKELCGVKVEDVDALKQKYDNIIRTSVDPRILTTIHAVLLDEERYALVFWIPQSWNRPHRVALQGHNKFYSRNSSGKYEMDTSELRTAFNSTLTLRDKMEAFKKSRIDELYSNKTPVALHYPEKLTIHWLPMEAFYKNDVINIPTSTTEILKVFSPNGDEFQHRKNFEGIVFHSGSEHQKASTYTQIYRQGIFEAVSCLIANKSKTYLATKYYEEYALNKVKYFVDLSKKLGINPPFFVYLTFSGIENLKIYPDHPFNEGYPIDRGILELPNAILDSYETSVVNVLIPMFERVWNACGLDRPPNYVNENSIFGSSA